MQLRKNRAADVVSSFGIPRSSSFTLGLVLIALTCVGCGNPSAAQRSQSTNQSKLEAAIVSQDFDGVRSAIAAGAPVNDLLPSGVTPLIQAIRQQNVSIVRLLLQSGADPNKQAYPSASPPLGAAVYATHGALIRELLKAGADPNKRFDKGRLTPLGLAAIAGSGAAIGALIDGGADVNGWNLSPPEEYPSGYHPGKVEGLTPLMLAAKGDHYPAVLVLLDKGADPSIRNERGRTASDLIGTHEAEIRDALAHPGRFKPVREW